MAKATGEEEDFADLYNSMAHAAEDALGTASGFAPGTDWQEGDDRVSLLAFDDDETSQTHRTTKLKPHMRSLLCCVSGLRAACQVVLVAGETSIVPYLVEGGLPISTAALVFVINPVICFLLHPWLRNGLASNTVARHKEKRASAVVFTIAGAAALLVLTQLEIIQEKYGFERWSVSAYIMFGIVDVCAETLMWLGNCALEDGSEGEDAVLSYALQTSDTVGAFGRMAACCVAALPVERLIPLFHGWAHMRAFFVVAALLFLGMGGTMVLALQEPPAKPQRTAQVQSAQAGAEPGLSPSKAVNSLMSMEGRLSDRGSCALRLLWLATLIGRVLVLEMSLYWTSWIGYSTLVSGTPFRLGCLGLGLQGLSSALTSLALDSIEARLADFRITFFGALVCTAACMSCLAASLNNTPAYLLLSFLSGCGYAVLMHSPRRITTRVLAAEDLLDQRSLYLGLVTSVAPIAQVVVGLASGLVLWMFFGAQVAWFFTFTGTVGLVAFGVLIAVEFHFGWLLEYTEKAKAKPKSKGNIGNH